MVELRVIGSGDAFGSGGRFQACLLLRGGGGDALLDCGATSLVAMKRGRVDPSGIGHVIVSHLHGDHFGGLPFLVLDGQFTRRVRPLRIAGPPGVRERVESAMEVFFPGSTTATRRFEVRFTELGDRIPARVGPVTVTPFAVDHASGAPAHALRVEYGGKAIAYSGDTAWTDALIDVARGADLFICESYSFDKEVRYHLAYRRLLGERHRLDCRRIVLTHLGADMLAHVDEADLECAGDGSVIQL